MTWATPTLSQGFTGYGPAAEAADDKGLFGWLEGSVKFLPLAIKQCSERKKEERERGREERGSEEEEEGIKGCLEPQQSCLHIHKSKQCPESRWVAVSTTLAGSHATHVHWGVRELLARCFTDDKLASPVSSLPECHMEGSGRGLEWGLAGSMQLEA